MCHKCPLVTPARRSRGAAQATNSQKVGCANGTPWAMRARRPRARYDRRGERSLAAAAGKVFVLTFCAAGSGHTTSSTRSASAMVAVLFVRTFTISAETGTIGKGQSTSHARRSRASIGPGTGGATSVAPREFLHANMSCAVIPDGAYFGHSCQHRPPPHIIKVCIVKSDNRRIFPTLAGLASNGPGQGTLTDAE